MTILKPVYTSDKIDGTVSIYNTLKKVLPATAKVEICDLGGMYTIMGSNEVEMYVDKLKQDFKKRHN